jgi:hypothetical protein
MTDGIRSRTPTRWIDRDPERYRRDVREVSAAFPDLVWTDVGAGGWDGVLPLWPFDRPAPTGLNELAGHAGLHVEVRYPQAYPMVPPSIRALNPEPDFREWTVHGWHVNGDGTLCLLLTMSLWDPQSSVVELLLKAAGWRIEYALMKVGAIDAMTSSGIVSDDSLDELIAASATRSSGRDQ